MMTVRRGVAVAVLKTEPAVAAEVAEVAAVAMARADNNQQREVKTVMAAIAVGKRRQARGENMLIGHCTINVPHPMSAGRKSPMSVG